jgi:hypothetical protein
VLRSPAALLPSITTPYHYSFVSLTLYIYIYMHTTNRRPFGFHLVDGRRSRHSGRHLWTGHGRPERGSAALGAFAGPGLFRDGRSSIVGFVRECRTTVALRMASSVLATSRTPARKKKSTSTAARIIRKSVLVKLKSAHRSYRMILLLSTTQS